MNLSYLTKTTSSFTLNLDSIPTKTTDYRVSVIAKLENGTYLDAVTKDIQVQYNPVDKVTASCDSSSITIDGTDIIIQSAGIYDFKLNYYPTSGVNVDVTDNVTIETTETCDAFKLTNTGRNGFRISIDTMPASITTCPLKIVAILENGLSIELTYNIIMKIVPTIKLNGADSLVAKNGTCSSNYTFTYEPTDYNVNVVFNGVSITSGDDTIDSKLSIVDPTSSGFTLNVTNVNADLAEDPVITASFTVDGKSVILTKTILITYKHIVTPFVIINNSDEDASFSFKTTGSSSRFYGRTVSNYSIGDYENILLSSDEYYVRPSSSNLIDITLKSKLAYLIIYGGDYTASISSYFLFIMTTNDFDFDGDVLAITNGYMLAYSCYHMFENCTAITKTPELSSLSLVLSCYDSMFAGCTSLVTASELPATTLANYCYRNMFKGCTNLTNITSSLPATTLSIECYENMFYGCSSITKTPNMLFTTLSSTKCCYCMFANCISLTDVPEILSPITLTENCYLFMFAGCTSLTKAPELPATTLATYCYSTMFQNCTSLLEAPELPATTLTTYCYYNMFYGCTNLTKAPILRANTAPEGSYESMFYGCSSLSKVVILSTSHSSANPLGGTMGTGIYYKNILLSSSYYQMPTGWTVEDYPFYITDFTVLDGAGSITSKDTTDYGDILNIISVTPTDSTLVATINSDNKTFTLSVSGITETLSTTYTVVYTLNGVLNSITKSITVTYLKYITPFILYNVGDEATVGLQRLSTSLPTIQLYYAVVSNYTEGEDYDDHAVEYSLYENNVTSELTIASVPNGSALLLKGATGVTWSISLWTYSKFIMKSGSFKAYGTISSLNRYEKVLELHCYSHMFYECTSLIKAPDLSSLTLATGCFEHMFQNCTSLLEAPKLPQTILADQCYQYMFNGCTSITQAPELPATTLTSSCYYFMFSKTSISTLPELNATTLAYGCYSYMFGYCDSIELINLNLSVTTLCERCYLGMFTHCKKLQLANVTLPATTLTAYCYSDMFSNCDLLTTVPKLPATILAANCYSLMFYNCISLETAPELPATELVASCYTNMFNGCSKLNYVKAMFTTTPSSDYTYSWLKDVASAGTFIKSKDATWYVNGVNSVPEGWTVEYASE